LTETINTASSLEQVVARTFGLIRSFFKCASIPLIYDCQQL